MSTENIDNEIEEIVNNSEGMSDVNNDKKRIDKFDAWWHLHL